MAETFTALFRLLACRPRPKGEGPLRDELLSIERLEERARSLAARFTVHPNPRRVARDVFPRFDDNARLLREAYRRHGRRRAPGGVRDAGGRVAPRQLPPCRFRDPGRPSASPTRLLLRAPEARSARARRPRACCRRPCTGPTSFNSFNSCASTARACWPSASQSTNTWLLRT